MYNYKAKCNRVVDGDTLILDIDMGFSIHSIHSCRMLGYNAPERSEKELNQKCVDKLSDLVIGNDIIIGSKKDDKYGRYLVDIFYIENNNLIYVNKIMKEFVDDLLQANSKQ